MVDFAGENLVNRLFNLIRITDYLESNAYAKIKVCYRHSLQSFKTTSILLRHESFVADAPCLSRTA